MAEKNRLVLKEYFQAGDRPTADNFSDLIDSGLNKPDDKASIADIETGIDDAKFVTSSGAKASVLKFAPVQSVNGETGVIVIPPVTSITGNAATATALQNPRMINGVSFNGTADVVFPDDSTEWQNAGFQIQSPVLSNAAGFSPVRYRKKNGIVFLEGVIANGTNQISGTSYVLFTLPEDLRPVYKLVFLTLNLNNTRGRVDIDATGKVYGVVYNSSGMSLDGVSFVP